MNYKPDARKLKMVCDAVVGAPEFRPRNGKTYCNLAIRKILDGLGLDLFYSSEKRRPMLANEMIDYMEAQKSKFGIIKDGTDAFEEAKQGIIVIACEKGSSHGHVAVVYPSNEMGYSPSWKRLVPFLANVGKVNGTLLASRCFQEEPKYYCVLPF